MDRAGALALARGARRLFVKSGPRTLRFEAGARQLTDDELAAYLVHDDGLLRVPVLIDGDLLVRGYTEELYQETLDGSQPGGPAGTA